MSLSNKVAIVTGASSGIGAAIAEKFAAEGAHVAIVDRNKNKLSAVEQRMRQAGAEPLPIFADVTDEDDVKRIINDTIKQFGKLDILVNNAGIFNSSSILQNDAMKIFDSVMTTNLRSAVYLTHLAAPHLIETKGNIINTSSAGAITVFRDPAFSYCTSKAALDHFSRCVAKELASKGVRVNTINPGPVLSNVLENAGFDEKAQPMMWENMKDMTTLNRVSDAEEVADLAVFLAGDKAKSITGSSYVTDNGMLLK